MGASAVVTGGSVDMRREVSGRGHTNGRTVAGLPPVVWRTEAWCLQAVSAGDWERKYSGYLDTSTSTEGR